MVGIQLAVDKPEATRVATLVRSGHPQHVAVIAAGTVAIVGLAEVVLQRIAGPVSAHIPLTGAGRSLITAVRTVGDFASGATAALVVLTATALATWLWRIAPRLAALVLVAVGTTVFALLAPASATRLVVYAVVLAGVVALAVGTTGGAGRRAAVSVLALGVAAVHWPLLVEEAGAVAGATTGAGGVAAARTLAEGAFLVAGLLAAVVLVRRGAGGRRAWTGAVIGASLAAIALTARPDYAAMTSIWAMGATLALPPLAYVVAAAAAGFVATTWWTDPERRLRLAGLALLVVAGLQPAAIHHSLTALVAVVLLAAPFGASADSPNGPVSSEARALS